MCHVAAWVLDGEWSAPHGAVFWRWADALMVYEEAQWSKGRNGGAGARMSGRGGSREAAAGGGRRRHGVEEEEEEGPLVITRLHNYETHMPHRWQCSNTE